MAARARQPLGRPRFRTLVPKYQGEFYAYWLFKSKPFKWSWDNLQKAKRAPLEKEWMAFPHYSGAPIHAGHEKSVIWVFLSFPNLKEKEIVALWKSGNEIHS